MEAENAEITRLPVSGRRVARRAFPKVASGDPGELRKCPKAPEALPPRIVALLLRETRFRPNRTNIARFGPFFVRVRPRLRNIWRCPTNSGEFRPNDGLTWVFLLPDMWPTSAKFGRSLPMPVKLNQRLAQIGQFWSNLTTCCSNVSNSDRYMAQIEQSVSNLGGPSAPGAPVRQVWAATFVSSLTTFQLHLASFGQNWPDVGQSWGNASGTFGHLRSSPGSPESARRQGAVKTCTKRGLIASGRPPLESPCVAF